MSVGRSQLGAFIRSPLGVRDDGDVEFTALVAYWNAARSVSCYDLNTLDPVGSPVAMTATAGPGSVSRLAVKDAPAGACVASILNDSRLYCWDHSGALLWDIDPAEAGRRLAFWAVDIWTTQVLVGYDDENAGQGWIRLYNALDGLQTADHLVFDYSGDALPGFTLTALSVADGRIFATGERRLSVSDYERRAYEVETAGWTLSQDEIVVPSRAIQGEVDFSAAGAHPAGRAFSDRGFHTTVAPIARQPETFESAAPFVPASFNATTSGAFFVKHASGVIEKRNASGALVDSETPAGAPVSGGFPLTGVGAAAADYGQPIIDTPGNDQIDEGDSYAKTLTYAPIRGTDVPIWTLENAPAGMTVDSMGQVAWSPAVAGTYNIVCNVFTSLLYRDSSGWQLEVQASGGIAPVIQQKPDAFAAVGFPYSDGNILTAGDPPITWSHVQAPSGMTIDPATGDEEWLSPSAAGSPYTIIVRAENAAGFDEMTYTLTVL